jgi:DNA-binding CsgD family transcriptional regulator/tetratricopeptide (TPR) repeat protein
VTIGDGARLPGVDRAAVERTARELVLGIVQERTPTGVSVVIDGPPGIGKSFLAREILASVAPGAAKVLRVAGQRGRRNDPMTVASQLLGDLTPDTDLADAAFDHIDQLCASGPVVLCADDAHNLDAASLTLLRRLVWASRSLPLAVLVLTRAGQDRESLTMLTRQAQARLWLPPMGALRVERLVFDQTGRWPGPQLRRILEMAAGNPLFVGELLRGYEKAGALAAVEPDTIETRFELDLRATGLDEVIRAQLGELDEPTRDVLAAMAVWGTDIGADDLASMLFSSAGTLDELLGRAVLSGLVRRDPIGTVGFRHDLFREVTYRELTESQRRAAHRRAAEVLKAAGYRPSLVTDHLLRATGTDADAALGAALHEAVTAIRGYAPEVTAELLDDATAVGADVPDRLLLDHADALFRQGRGQSAETLARERIATITDPAVAAGLQLILIRSLMNRAEAAAALAVIQRTVAIAGLPGAAVRQLEGTRAWLLIQVGQGLPAVELDVMMARFAAAGDKDAQANLLTSVAFTAFSAGRPDVALDHIRAREALLPGTDSFRFRNSTLSLPAVFELAVSGPAAARAELDRARRLAAERHAEWIDPFLGIAAGGIAVVAGDWDDAVAELDTALEQAEETGAGWVSHAVGYRAYIDAHRGNSGQARARLEAFRHRGLPLQWGHDRPGWAELAVLEAEGRIREASTLARTLWSTARDHPGPWAAELALDVTRVALAGMNRRLAHEIEQDVPALCSPEVSLLARGMLAADPDMVGAAADDLACAGRFTAEAFAREELACAAAASGDRNRAEAALDAALDRYQRMAATPDRDRTLARMRALGIRRSSREPRRDASHGWDSLTATEVRIAALVREGLTNREIGTRLFVSPRTVQTHVSHILQKTGLRSRVEIALLATA